MPKMRHKDKTLLYRFFFLTFFKGGGITKDFAKYKHLFLINGTEKLVQKPRFWVQTLWLDFENFDIFKQFNMVR